MSHGISSFTVLMLHLDGADGATSTSDSSFTSPKTVTFTGNAQLSTGQLKFGTASLLVDGTGDSIRFGAEADFAFGTGDFTIDFWFRSLDTPVDAGKAPALVDFRPASTEGLYPVIYWGTDGKLRLYVSSGVQILSATVLSINTWYHLALTRASGSTRLFLDGVQQGSTYSDSNNYAVGTSAPRFGVSAGGIQTDAHVHYDEIRINKGLAAWTANFTPETEPYDAIEEAVGAASGTGTAAAVGASTFTAVGAASGTGAAAADSTGSGINEGVGAAAGVGTALAIAHPEIDVVGACASFFARGRPAIYSVAGEAVYP